MDPVGRGGRASGAEPKALADAAAVDRPSDHAPIEIVLDL